MLMQYFIKLFLVLGLVDISTIKSKNSILRRKDELNIVFISYCNLGAECMADCISVCVCVCLCVSVCVCVWVGVWER